MVIVMVGIPGSGKSTVALELAKLLNGKCYLEATENDFPDYVKRRNIYGEFSTMTWFRNKRVKQLLDAIRNTEQISVVDTYFDKLMYLCRNSDGLSWLISRESSYWQASVSMWLADYKELPQVDVACGLKIKKDLWERFVTERNAYFDDLKYFRSHCFSLQKSILHQTQKLFSANNKLYISADQDGRPPNEIAKILYDKIIENRYV